MSLFINSGRIKHLDVGGKCACGNGGRYTSKTKDLSQVTCRGCIRSSAARSDEARTQSNLADAAPDLLEVAKGLESFVISEALKSQDIAKEFATLKRKARAAIAKAEGR